MNIFPARSLQCKWRSRMRSMMTGVLTSLLAATLFLATLPVRARERATNEAAKKGASERAAGASHPTSQTFGFVIHGGAGTILKNSMTPELEAAYREKLKEALMVGYNILKSDGSSLDAVEAAIRVMEDSPLFNAGKGAVFTSEGTNELDASIMDGKTLMACGA